MTTYVDIFRHHLLRMTHITLPNGFGPGDYTTTVVTVFNGTLPEEYTVTASESELRQSRVSAPVLPPSFRRFVLSLVHASGFQTDYLLSLNLEVNCLADPELECLDPFTKRERAGRGQIVRPIHLY